MHRDFWILMEEWSKPEHGNLVFVSEYASPKGDENWECVWKSNAPKSQDPTRRRTKGPPAEKLFMFKAVRRNSKRKRA